MHDTRCIVGVGVGRAFGRDKDALKRNGRRTEGLAYAIGFLGVGGTHKDHTVVGC